MNVTLEAMKRVADQKLKAARWIPRLRWAKVYQVSPFMVQFPGQAPVKAKAIGLPELNAQVLTGAWRGNLVAWCSGDPVPDVVALGSGVNLNDATYMVPGSW